jgi:hypothetical protein
MWMMTASPDRRSTRLCDSFVERAAGDHMRSPVSMMESHMSLVVGITVFFYDASKIQALIILRKNL